MDDLRLFLIEVQSSRLQPFFQPLLDLAHFGFAVPEHDEVIGVSTSTGVPSTERGAPFARCL
ncbi:hypothetical protein AVL59_39790 [Streptomyces griseochromogenes]|uniref:Uncharacterized protein n=1 Tax=Streptomyces griseochromogenes TaxID=68214 RepID=A0A1B1B806_9ACTN|nr:hypothetical protein AVL59_39790 [Streptomyces griseochromogenes]